jgi:hypothetical protein
MSKIKIFAVASVLFGCTFFANTAQAQDKPINKEQLPKAAQEFLSKYFADAKVLYVLQDDDFAFADYEVKLANGIEIEFNHDGVWENVDGNRKAIPTGFINENIVKYVAAQYPDAKIVEIDRGRNKFEVTISNGLEMIFSKSGKLLGIDD